MSEEVAKVRLELENHISGKMDQIAKDLEKKFGDIQKNTQAVTQGFSNANMSFGKLVAGMAGGSLVAGAISKIKDSALGLVGALVKSNSSLEQSKVAFGVLLNSTSKADELLRKLYKFAAETPFETSELLAASKSLLAFGASAEEIPDQLKQIGDIASGIGAPIGEIAELYGKARVQGRLFQEDINQLTGRGIPIIQELAKQFKVSEANVKSLVEQGRVSFGNLEQAFRDLSSEGGKFSGMMEKQSKTFAGMLSTLKDNLSQVLIQVGSGGVFDVMTTSLKRANELVNTNQAAIANFSRTLGAKLGTAVQFVVDHFQELITVGKILIGVFAVQKLVGIATAIRGIGLALTGLTATNPILLSIGLVLGTATIAFSKAKEASHSFNSEAENIRDGERQLSQYNSTLQKVAELHKKAASNNPFAGIKAPTGQVDPNSLSPLARASYDAAISQNPASGPSKPSKSVGLGPSEDELKKQAKQLQETQDRLRDSQIASLRDSQEREFAALDEKYKREQRDLAGNHKALKVLEEAYRQDKANMQSRFEEEELMAQAKVNEKYREAKYQNALKERKILSDQAKEEERVEARRMELQELRREQAASTASNLLAAGQMVLAKNKENAGILKTMAIGEIIVNSSRAIMSTLATGGFWSMPLAVSMGVLGAAQVARVASTPMYEQGGPVLGPRHSRGGVNANLEGGEFVLSRRDVSSLGGFSGVENMRRGNSSPTFNLSTSIVINGSANPSDVRKAVEKSMDEKIAEFKRISEAAKWRGGKAW